MPDPVIVQGVAKHLAPRHPPMLRFILMTSNGIRVKNCSARMNPKRVLGFSSVVSAAQHCVVFLMEKYMA